MRKSPLWRPISQPSNDRGSGIPQLSKSHPDRTVIARGRQSRRSGSIFAPACLRSAGAAPASLDGFHADAFRHPDTDVGRFAGAGGVFRPPADLMPPGHIVPQRPFLTPRRPAQPRAARGFCGFGKAFRAFDFRPRKGAHQETCPIRRSTDMTFNRRTFLGTAVAATSLTAPMVQAASHARPRAVVIGGGAGARPRPAISPRTATVRSMSP